MDKITDLKGKAVLTSDGKNVGTLADLAIDEHTWRITSIVVEVDPAVSAIFGVKKKLLKAARVKISTDKVEHLADVVKLRETLGELKVELH